MPAKHTLVILPGWGGSHESWASFMALATKDLRVVCIDLPCFGDTPCPDTAWGIEEYAEFAVEKIKALVAQDGKVYLLGHSFGGQVATFVAAHHAEYIERLILVAPAIVRTKNTVRRAVFRYLAKSGEWIFRLPIIEKKQLAIKKVFYHLIGAGDYVETAGIKREIFKKIIRQDLQYLLPNIHIPVLVLWGTVDAYTPYREGKIITTLLPRAKLVTFTGGTHGLHLYRTKEIHGAIVSFLHSSHV